MFNMRIYFQLFIFTIVITAGLTPAKIAFADVDDYYSQLRKLKNPTPEAIESAKQKYVDTEQVKKMNEISQKNKQHSEEVAKKPSRKPKDKTPSKDAVAGAPEVTTPSKKQKTTPISRSESTSGPIKVDSDTPDELSFPGDDEKGADAPAPAPKKK